MFVAVSTRTMASAKFKAAPADEFVHRTVEQMRTERRAQNRELLLRRERERGHRELLEAQRAQANEAIRKANEVLRVFRSADIRLETIVSRICRVTKVTPGQLKSELRSRAIVFARQAVFYWARRLSKLSYPTIGKEFGNRDHTTILHGCHAYREKRMLMGRVLREAR